MYQEIINLASCDNGLWVHVGIFIALILGGFGLPIPEDIPLILAGVAVAKKVVTPEGVFLTCYVGVLIADQLVYAFGFIFGKKLLAAGTRSPWFPSITEERVEQVREGLRKKRLLYIFIGRHLFPVRAMTFVTAGALHVPFAEFLLADAIAALVSVTIMVGIGFFLGSAITPEVAESFSSQLHYWIIGILLLSALCYVIFHYGVNNKAKAVSSSEGPAAE